MTIIINVQIYDFIRYSPKSFIAFDTKIRTVDSMEAYENYKKTISSYTLIDGKGKFVLPGLIAGHTHIYSTFARGWIHPFSPTNFQDILTQQWWKLDKALGEKEIYYSGITSAEAFLKNGITTVFDHHASGTMIRGSLATLKEAVVDTMGLRGLFCFEISDRFDSDTCIEENVSFFEKMKQTQSNEARGFLGLHASMSLGDNTLRKIEQTPSSMPLHVHVAESIEDVTWTKEHTGLSILQRFNSFHLLRKDSIYVHGVHLEEKDFDLIKKMQGILAFNPSSNMNNGVGLPPVDWALKKKIPFIVGNDGLSFNIAHEFQTLIFSSNLSAPNHFKLEALLHSIRESYRYASRQLGCLLGELKEGYEADLMIVDYDAITPITDENAFGHFIYGICDHLQPEDVFVKGQHRICQYAYTQNISQELQEAHKCAKALWNKIIE